MIERGCRLGFVDEARPLGLRRRDVLWQELQGDQATERGVFGFIDNPHTALAEFGEDPVVRYGPTDHTEVCSRTEKTLRLLGQHAM